MTSVMLAAGTVIVSEFVSGLREIAPFASCHTCAETNGKFARCSSTGSDMSFATIVTVKAPSVERVAANADT